MSKPSEIAGVFQRYRREVYGWAFRLLGRHHDALDAAQDVFVRWIDQSRRQTPANPRGWLRQVTINRAIDLLRSRRGRPGPQRERTETANSHGCPTPPGWGTDSGRSAAPEWRGRRFPPEWGTEVAISPEESADPLEREELRRDIADSLGELTDAQRTVLVAKVYDGMTFAEIAAEQGLAVPTVKTHYLRALSAVRDRLRRRWGPERSLP